MQPHFCVVTRQRLPERSQRVALLDELQLRFDRKLYQSVEYFKLVLIVLRILDVAKFHLKVIARDGWNESSNLFERWILQRWRRSNFLLFL